MGVHLLIDFGSTFTKVLAVDMDREIVLGRAQAPSTADEDITIGLRAALDALFGGNRSLEPAAIERRLACSSAAGGLRMVAVGLVPELTVEAARRAALGAGAKLIRSYAYELDDEAIAEIEARPSDVILLAGGTDGGNKDVILSNAGRLAACGTRASFIVAGNKVVAAKVTDILRSAGKHAERTENVLPELGTLNVEPARAAIREVFIKRVVHAKGLDKAEAYVGDILMPTPMATLKAARLLADGNGEEPGLGELMVVEIGGATTNIHTIADGYPSQPDVLFKGLPEPYAKRTVEGDLGLRHNAVTILEVAGADRLSEALGSIADGKGAGVDFRQYASALSRNPGFVPESDEHFSMDAALARAACEVAVGRHAGSLEETPSWAGGAVRIQRGKDLSALGTVIGTGGIFCHGRHADKVLAAALFSRRDPFSLRPRKANFYVDAGYIMYGVGLLSDVLPAKALRLAKKCLRRIEI